MSDAQGRFVAPDVPGSTGSIILFKKGYVYPCGVTVGVQSDLSAEVELVPVESLNTTNPQPLMTTRPLITGTVFEMTPDGPKTVAGAYVYVETWPDLTVADTVTDLTGHFTICDGTGGHVYAGKTGYGSSAGAPAVDGMTLEIKRQ